MKKQQWVAFVSALALIAATAGWLVYFRANQKLGAPGVKTHPIADSIRLEVDLPDKVLDCDSEGMEVDDTTKGTLPQDTSFGQRLYRSTNSYPIALSVVLMGSDRSSLHKPQICLEGRGWHIDDSASTQTSVHVEKPYPYELPIVKLVANETSPEPGRAPYKRVYVYWFVADNAMSATISGAERMWMLSKQLVRTGVLQRWAYITCTSVCPAGQEDAQFERIKTFIAAAAPAFQLTPKPAPTTLTATTVSPHDP
jgi:hypothetical protein